MGSRNFVEKFPVLQRYSSVNLVGCKPVLSKGLNWQSVTVSLQSCYFQKQGKRSEQSY